MPRRKKTKNPKKPAKRSRGSAEDRADVAAIKKGMRHLRRHGGIIMYDARQII